jgi:hypothetical protein
MRQKELRGELRERWALCHASFCTTNDLLYRILGVLANRIIHPGVLRTMLKKLGTAGPTAMSRP